MKLDLNELRKEINEIDSEIVALFKKRMAISASIAEYKKAHGLPILDEAREKALLERVASLSGEELEAYSVELYRTVMELSKSYQKAKLEES